MPGSDDTIVRLAARLEAAGARLCLGFPTWLRLVLRHGTVAITLGRRVYVSPSLLNRSSREIAAVAEHELEHVRQFARVGLIPFAWRYARDYMLNRWRGMDSFEAYEAITFEVEARIAERRSRSPEESGEEAGIA